MNTFRKPGFYQTEVNKNLSFVR